MNNKEKIDLIVVKVGTNTLTNTNQQIETLNYEAFRRIGKEALELSNKGNGVILVSSGGITAGTIADNVRRKDIQDSAELQRYAARGWHKVIETWGSVIGQDRVTSTLLTKQELQNQTTREKTLGAIACCLAHQDIFIANENDIICDDEIKFGDNDTLAAELATECAKSGFFESVSLVLLTNVDGLRKNKDDASTLIRTVTSLEEARLYAGDSVDEHSRGGMITKVRAAEIASGIASVCIAHSAEDRAISRALGGEMGTRFCL